MKSCMLCANLYTRSSGITDEDGTELLTCSVVHESELVFATDNTVIATVDRLAARKNVDSSAVFLKRQQIVGFNHEPHGCLLAPELRGLLRPVTQYCNDPQHTLFVSGGFNTIVYLFFETLWMGGMKNIYEVFQQFLSDWSWPASAGTQKGIHDIFSKNRVDSWRKSKHASALLGSVWPCTRLWHTSSGGLSCHGGQNNAVPSCAWPTCWTCACAFRLAK